MINSNRTGIAFRKTRRKAPEGKGRGVRKEAGISMNRSNRRLTKGHIRFLREGGGMLMCLFPGKTLVARTLGNRRGKSPQSFPLRNTNPGIIYRRGFWETRPTTPKGGAGWKRSFSRLGRKNLHPSPGKNRGRAPLF